MRKIFLAVLALFVLAGCDHTDGFGMEFDADPDVIRDVGLFQKLDVELGTSLVPQRAVRQVTVDSDRFLTVVVRFYEDFDMEPAYECNGMEVLDEQTYEVILSYVYDADIMNYADDGVYPDGVVPAHVACELSDGRINDFAFAKASSDELTEQEQIISEMLAYLGDVAEQEIQDCNANSYKFDDDYDEDDSDQEGEGSEDEVEQDDEESDEAGAE